MPTSKMHLCTAIQPGDVACMAARPATSQWDPLGYAPRLTTRPGYVLSSFFFFNSGIRRIRRIGRWRNHNKGWILHHAAYLRTQHISATLSNLTIEISRTHLFPLFCKSPCVVLHIPKLTLLGYDTLEREFYLDPFPPKTANPLFFVEYKYML